MAEVKQDAVGGLLPVRSGSVPTAAEETILTEQGEQFKSRGFTVLRGVLSAAEVAAVRERLDVRMAAKLAARLGSASWRESQRLVRSWQRRVTSSASVAPPTRPSSASQACWRRRRRWPSC